MRGNVKSQQVVKRFRDVHRLFHCLAVGVDAQLIAEGAAELFHIQQGLALAGFPFEHVLDQIVIKAISP
jgi:hypothetical protein